MKHVAMKVRLEKLVRSENEASWAFLGRVNDRMEAIAQLQQDEYVDWVDYHLETDRSSETAVLHVCSIVPVED